MNNRTNYTGNVVPFRARPRAVPCEISLPGSAGGNAFDQLTATIIMDRHRRGELEPALLEALLVGVGFNVDGAAQ